MQTRSSWIWCWIIGAVLASSASAQVYVSLIDNLPTCIGNRNGRIISVSDAVDDSDCSVGGATGENRFVHPCICDTLNALGPYWKAVGGGSGGAGDVLLAGDADGQTIQGITGSNRARVDLSVLDPEAAQLIGGGDVSTAIVSADKTYVQLNSADTNTNCSVTNGSAECNSDGAVTFSVTPGGYFGATPTSFYAGSPDGFTTLSVSSSSIDLSASVDGTVETASVFTVNTSGVNVDLQDGLQQYEVTAAAGFNFAGTRFRINVPAPTNANDACFAGMIAWDSSHFYVCIATDTWVRVAMATWP